MPPVFENSISPEPSEPAMPSAWAIFSAPMSNRRPTTTAVPKAPTTPGEWKPTCSIDWLAEWPMR
ncbi:hypothetical protein D3C83_35240 [compost metagenome]